MYSSFDFLQKPSFHQCSIDPGLLKKGVSTIKKGSILKLFPFFFYLTLGKFSNENGGGRCSYPYSIPHYESPTDIRYWRVREHNAHFAKREKWLIYSVKPYQTLWSSRYLICYNEKNTFLSSHSLSFQC
jgi:hypothetical protein